MEAAVEQPPATPAVVAPDRKRGGRPRGTWAGRLTPVRKPAPPPVPGTEYAGLVRKLPPHGGRLHREELVSGKTVFTTGQAAKLFGCASRTVTKWTDTGLLAAFRIPGSLDRRIKWADLAAFAAANDREDVVESLKKFRPRREKPVLSVGLAPGYLPGDVTPTDMFDVAVRVKDYEVLSVVFGPDFGLEAACESCRRVLEVGDYFHTAVILGEGREPYSVPAGLFSAIFTPDAGPAAVKAWIDHTRSV